MTLYTYIHGPYIPADEGGKAAVAVNVPEDVGLRMAGMAHEIFTSSAQQYNNF